MSARMSVGEKAEEFRRSQEYRMRADAVLERLQEFRRKYPFRARPGRIDKLTAKAVYNPGHDYFFRWVVHELKDLAHVKCYANVFENAIDDLDEFKTLMRAAVDDAKSLAEKVNAPWPNIQGMGGDRQLAKKIICCYYDDVLPVLATADLETFYKLLVNPKLPPDYYGTSVGEKFQFLNQALLDAKEALPQTKMWDNVYFMWFLYVTYMGLS